MTDKQIIERLKKDLDFERTKRKTLQTELNQCKEILEEIREDLETQIYCECSECGNDDYSECINCMTKRYLQKINECEVINDRKPIKEIKQPIYDLPLYYDQKCDYSKGYLDGIFAVCKVFEKNAVRTELGMDIEE